ncbi:hypothetical protein GWK47_046016 [Chionoecetes opilio]|uniref:Uncharacterized protein n=1 Tax=Chionoecetes opilio TaxID=41210 RepID=A0A8J5CH94_CHIOP|nr:hypothetical protein GWK47_046016 [Chionoecetes opilio]
MESRMIVLSNQYWHLCLHLGAADATQDFDALQTSTAHQQLMEQQVEELMATLASLQLDHSQQGEVHQVIKRFSLLAGTARNMTTSLTHCLSLMKQQEEEHNELEESIASHVSSNASSIYNTPANSYVSLPRPRRFFDACTDDEFFDAFSQGLLLL